MVDRSGFDEANRRIHIYESQTAFGNTPEAVEMARRFGDSMAAMSRLAFTGHRTDDSGTMTQGHFLAHVEMRADTVCFLAHVPQLRDYRGDVREALLDLAWVAARESTQRLRPGQDVELAVALRGVLLYGAIAVGPVSGEKPRLKQFDGAVSTDPLPAFFNGPAYTGPFPTEVAPTPSPTPIVPTPTPTPDLGPRVRELRQTLRSGSARERQTAAADLANLGAAHIGGEGTADAHKAALASVLPDLRKASRGSDATLRLFALRAMANIQREESLPALIRAFDDPDPRVRSEAMRVLVPFSEHARSAVPALVERSRSNTPSDRGGAVQALTAIGMRAPEARADVFGVLQRLSDDPDPNVRHWAVDGIKEVKKIMDMETARSRPQG